MTTEPDSAGRKQTDTRFKPGQSGNPAGRQKGSRNRLSERFIADFCEIWEKHGIEALRKLANDDPAAFCRVAASLLPKVLEHGGVDGDAIQIETREFKATDLARRISAIIEKAAEEMGEPDAAEDARQGLGDDRQREV
jgi:Family of unknown function (DUF5681)